MDSKSKSKSIFKSKQFPVPYQFHLPLKLIQAALLQSVLILIEFELLPKSVDIKFQD